MNRLILEPSDFISEDLVLIHGARAEHLLGVCKLKPGDPIKLGLLNGPAGEGEVIESLTGSLKIRYIQSQKRGASELGEVCVMMALPRPQMVKKILQKAATFGVRKLVLFRSERVEKSYFGSPVLSSEEIKKNLILGLEQGGKTKLPEVVVLRLQREFNQWRAEQNFQSKFLLSLNSKNTILDYSRLDQSGQHLTNASFLIGPEGGFIPKEEERFIEEGFIPIRVSDSILRVESAFDFILAQHCLLQMSEH
jgi:16S rRNA (uracil1498-N3)-methyltransferase